jgi:hypothetical protein
LNLTAEVDDLYLMSMAVKTKTNAESTVPRIATRIAKSFFRAFCIRPPRLTVKGYEKCT